MLDFMKTLPTLVLAPPLLGLCVLGVYVNSFGLIKRHAAYIRTIWYFYFLLAFITLATGAGLARLGVIDSKGQVHGNAGDVWNTLLAALFSLTDDIFGACALVGVIVLPQLLSYVFSGVLSGCAGRPRFTQPVIRFVLLSLAKSFAVAAGALLGMVLLGWACSWEGASVREGLGLCMFSLITLMMSFHLLTILAGAFDPDERPKSGPHPRLRVVHDWMTRNSEKS